MQMHWLLSEIQLSDWRSMVLMPLCSSVVAFSGQTAAQQYINPSIRTHESAGV